MDNKEDKQYSPYEAALKVRSTILDMYNNSELAKASNSSHEIEGGEEPHNEDSECPESLKGDGAAPEPSGRDKKKKDGAGDSSDPEHEKGMSESEEKDHDAAENEADEKDKDKIEADEEKAEYEEDADKIIDDAAKPQKDSEKEKKNKFEKALFADKAVKCEPCKKSKSDVADDIKWELERLQKIKDTRWLVEDEVPEAKKAVEAAYEACKKKIKDMCKKYSHMKKSIEDEVDKIEKAEQGQEYKPELMRDKEKYHENAQKSEGAESKDDGDVPKYCKYCGNEKQMDKTMTNDAMGAPISKEYGKSSKLGSFLDKKKAKNQKMEKFLGVKNKQGMQDKASAQKPQQMEEKPSGMKGY